MNRSPYYSPMARAADMDVGGAADLQTDIMRFMAILALCLVAIFALVQSIPLQPIESVRKPVAPKKIDAAPLKKIDPAPLTLAPLRPERQPPHDPPVGAASAAIQRQPPPGSPVGAASAAIQNSTTPPSPNGFTLRFASDSALTRLVARNEIGLFAIAPDRALRMSMNRGTPSFWPASAPNQYHEMDPGTVPGNVQTALRRAGTLGLDPDVKWGVTLPPSMRRQLDRYLGAHTGGELVIEATGNLRLEN